MSSDKAERLSRLFRRGRALIVAMDHGGFMPRPVVGLEDPSATAREVVAGGADGILAPLGSARAAREGLGDAQLVLTLQPADHATVERGVETARALDAAGVKVLVYPFLAEGPPGADCLGILAALGFECERLAMPLMAETIPGGWKAGGDLRTPEAIAAGARVGAELGADVIKTFGAGSAADFATVARNSLVPVVVLGGDRGGDVETTLREVRASLDGGAQGVAIGRSIWGHESPRRITAAISAMVHDDADVEQALKTLAG